MTDGVTGEKVITQGEEGDNFYILTAGSCDIFVSKVVKLLKKSSMPVPRGCTPFHIQILCMLLNEYAGLGSPERSRCWC